MKKDLEKKQGVKMKTLQFTDELMTINAVELVREIEREVAEQNGYKWILTFGSDNDIIYKVNEIIENIDDYGWDYIMYNTIKLIPYYPLYPWLDISDNEDTITDILLEHHIRATKDGIVEFYNPTKSPLYRFFLKYRDGCGWNISYAINTVIRVLEELIKDVMFEEGYIEKNGKWMELGWCEDCEDSFYEQSGVCPECNSPLEYSQGYII